MKSGRNGVIGSFRRSDVIIACLALSLIIGVGLLWHTHQTRQTDAYSEQIDIRLTAYFTFSDALDKAENAGQVNPADRTTFNTDYRVKLNELCADYVMWLDEQTGLWCDVESYRTLRIRDEVLARRMYCRFKAYSQPDIQNTLHVLAPTAHCDGGAFLSFATLRD